MIAVIRKMRTRIIVKQIRSSVRSESKIIITTIIQVLQVLTFFKLNSSILYFAINLKVGNNLLFKLFCHIGQFCNIVILNVYSIILYFAQENKVLFSLQLNVLKKLPFGHRKKFGSSRCPLDEGGKFNTQVAHAHTPHSKCLLIFLHSLAV